LTFHTIDIAMRIKEKKKRENWGWRRKWECKCAGRVGLVFSGQGGAALGPKLGVGSPPLFPPSQEHLSTVTVCMDSFVTLQQGCPVPGTAHIASTVPFAQLIRCLDRSAGGIQGPNGQWEETI